MLKMWLNVFLLVLLVPCATIACIPSELHQSSIFGKVVCFLTQDLRKNLGIQGTIVLRCFLLLLSIFFHDLCFSLWVHVHLLSSLRMPPKRTPVETPSERSGRNGSPQMLFKKRKRALGFVVRKRRQTIKIY